MGTSNLSLNLHLVFPCPRLPAPSGGGGLFHTLEATYSVGSRSAKRSGTPQRLQTRFHAFSEKWGPGGQGPVPITPSPPHLPGWLRRDVSAASGAICAHFEAHDILFLTVHTFPRNIRRTVPSNFLKLSANLDCWELSSACWVAAIFNISKISAPRPGASYSPLHRIALPRRGVSSRGVPMTRNSGNTAARNFAPGMYGSHAARPRSCESLVPWRTEAFGGSGLWFYGPRLPFVDPRFKINSGGLTTFGTVTALVWIGVTLPDSPLPLKAQVQLDPVLDILALSRSPIDAQTSGCRSYHPLNPGLISGHRPTHLGMGPLASETDTLLASSKLFNQLHLRSRGDGHTHIGMGLLGRSLCSPGSRLGIRIPNLSPFEFSSHVQAWAYGPRFGSLETQTLLGWVQRRPAFVVASRLNKFKFNNTSDSTSRLSQVDLSFKFIDPPPTSTSMKISSKCRGQSNPSQPLSKFQWRPVPRVKPAVTTIDDFRPSIRTLTQRAPSPKPQVQSFSTPLWPKLTARLQVLAHIDAPTWSSNLEFLEMRRSLQRAARRRRARSPAVSVNRGAVTVWCKRRVLGIVSTGDGHREPTESGWIDTAKGLSCSLHRGVSAAKPVLFVLRCCRFLVKMCVGNVHSGGVRSGCSRRREGKEGRRGSG
ncbi:hypothetical protein C8R46DRAFT_1189332, partial [Mycena filopes]